MQEWYVEQPQPTLNSGFESDEWDDYVGDAFDEILTETQLGKTVYLCRGQYDGETGLFETEVETEAVVQSETPDAYTQGWQRQILTRIGDAVQDYKYIKYDGKVWVIMTMPSDNTIYNKCVMHLCNYTLKWQDRKTAQIYYYPAYVADATQYNTGVQNRQNVIQTGYIQLMAWLSLDEISVAVERDMRMFIDTNKVNPAVYVITSKSTVPYSYGDDERVMRITFTEDQYDPDKDSIENWLCDYINPADIPQPTEPIEIKYSGEPQIRIGGRKTFTAMTENEVVFSLDYASVYEGKITMTQDGNKCTIKCANDTSMVGSHFNLIANYTGGQSELLISIKGAI